MEDYGVFPAILRVDIGAELDEAVGDVKPAVEGSHVERCAVVVISGLDEGGILLEELAHRSGVVLVGVPQYQGRAAHPSLLLLLLLVLVLGVGAAAAAAGRVAAGAHHERD